jgi:hypothetical protein
MDSAGNNEYAAGKGIEAAKEASAETNGVIGEAELYLLITGITTHLTAITAYYVGRTDLVRSPTAFIRIFPE